MMELVTERMSEDEWEQLVGLLYRYAETELDQFDNWRLDPVDYGPVYVILSQALPRNWPYGAFDSLPRPGTNWRTGRFAVVSEVERVETPQDVLRVIAQMRADLAGRGWREWENPTLPRFLEALEAVIEGLPGRLASQGKVESAQPDWALLAGILVAATGYE